ncbi:MAG: DegT/DnrJ/EryC1/StrS family aminotransferase [Acidimicrobiia bacterium]|nr:DegT/DnrJ/EryC1/StrS family aminotransferase [Acidimicrobiia bacterium]
MIPFLDLRASHDELRPRLDQIWHDIVDRSAFIGGEAVARFEANFASYVGRRHCIGVANGTDALVLAFQALGIGAGDEVVVPANTFVATVEAVTAVGAQPRFADVEPGRLLLDANEVEAVLTPRTRAIAVVHLYGQPVDMDAITSLATRHGLAVIEDAAQAHGATWRGRPIGSFGHASTFSFYPGKNLGAMGDGGAVVTDIDSVAATVRTLANHGRAPGSHTHHELDGRNSRLDGLQAAVLDAKLERLDAWNAARRQVHEWYRNELAGLGGVRLLDPHPNAEPVHHLEVVRIDGRDEARTALSAAEIGSGVHYPVPCHQQPPFARFADRPLAVSEVAAETQLSLPMHPHLTRGQVREVCRVLVAAATTNSSERAA